MKDKLKVQAVLNLEEGESISGMWITPHIPGTGFYKLSAKCKTNGEHEWAHYLQQENGNKKVLFRGTAKSVEELLVVLDIANKNLKRLFNEQIELQKASYSIYPVGDHKKETKWN
ncbi:MAG: hypothetical protein HY738_24600 [Bacteroidia bacterium]|nr:hypothetical protein [Bacteroidia bacterium]